MDHASQAAAEAAAAGESVVAMGGDGLVGALAGAVREHGVARRPAGRPRQRLRPRARDPVRRSRAPAACWPTGDERALDLGEANGRPFVCIASTGFDSEANRIANEARLVKGNLVYAYAALRALVAWRPTHVHGQARRRASTASRATRSSPPTRASTAAACGWRRRRTRPTACWRWSSIGKTSKLRFLANLPKVFTGSTSSSTECQVLPGARGRDLRGSAVRRLCGRRDPSTQPARHGATDARARCA